MISMRLAKNINGGGYTPVGVNIFEYSHFQIITSDIFSHIILTSIKRGKENE